MAASKQTPLSEIIIQQIRREGPISFRDFMEMCLYYPGMGYYTSLQNRIGAEGDYYTSACLTPAFGAMIGRQLKEMWDLLGERSFTIVEYGAGAGFLCHDILDHFSRHDTLYRQLNYCIIEKNAFIREQAMQHLPEKVRWYDSIRDIGAFTGCVLSNELVDNFPVHLVVMKDELMEVFVDYKDDFTELLLPASDTLKDYLKELNVHLPEGFRTEINLEATRWIKEIADCLKKGYVITIDYGHLSPELYREYRKEGTLICYHHHAINDHPYHHIGEQDITSHVNFSALYHWGLKHELKGCGYTDQAHFLQALGLEEYLTNITTPAQSYKDYRKKFFLLQTLLVDMGKKFKVLIQRKGTGKRQLAGLQLGIPAISSLSVT